MSHRHVAFDRAAIELALIGVTRHAVADILCS
ncbi:Ms4533A family Cys-rich leader peptide [Streptomyces sp. NPDC058659]|uniref:Ms4533A family Cys-rich leader peptide n=1 Tax=Streptomyces narbonensis TaxID=67333 RepID=A0ABV3CBB3_9ACTN|nr:MULTISPECIES: Ms4533A family Cys-rich leader peptide [Streptomyces]MDV5148211.1 Ms4533A family Cys-rich leader peptide [Streptomyces sp. SBC-4]WRK39301.1 Ms4533A family Cys-rich leader peptide [Streptomyces venezuelae]